MKRILKALSVSLILVLTVATSVMALTLSDLGKQITINDGLPNSGWGGGSSALGIAGEDNETEGNPNTITFQAWDLEGMFWNKSTSKLYMIGGFDYLSGVPGVLWRGGRRCIHSGEWVEIRT